MKPLECVGNIRAGKDARRAEEELYRFVRGFLLDRLRPRLEGRVRSRMDPEDVVQEAMLRVLASLGEFHSTSERAFQSWVLRIARNLIADQARRRSAAAVRFNDGSKTGAGPRESRLPSPRPRDESTFNRRDWIEAVLRRLKPREAEVIRLHRLEGRSFAAIAREWAKSEEAVKRFYSRSWDRFRDLASREKGSGR